jgi:hypothetical protein
VPVPNDMSHDRVKVEQQLRLSLLRHPSCVPVDVYEFSFYVLTSLTVVAMNSLAETLTVNY